MVVNWITAAPGFSFMLLSWFAHLYLINLLLKAATVVWLVLVLKDPRTGTGCPRSWRRGDPGGEAVLTQLQDSRTRPPPM